MARYYYLVFLAVSGCLLMLRNYGKRNQVYSLSVSDWLLYNVVPAFFSCGKGLENWTGGS